MSYLKNLNRNLSEFIATLFGIGHIPFAPGTFGTIFAFLIWVILPDYWFWNATSHKYFITGQIVFSLSCLFILIYGIYVSTIAELKLGHDSPKIIIDELLGFMISVAFLPKTFLIAVYGLIFFRVFDIAKPFPINKIQKLPAGFGVMADDLLAGIYSNIAIRLLLLFYTKVIV